MISQIVTLVGVLVGALTSYLSVTVAERTRHRRSMATRWDERKLNAYVEYATCVKEVVGVAKSARRAEEGSEAHKEFMAAMEEGELRRSALFETLMLLAAPPAIEAAHVINVALWERLDRARRHDPPSVADVDEFHELLNTYHDRAREDLGISNDSWQIG
ncbi:hypothetical protein AV521_13100 [Streptomyces sp. IMTB 2501]|uniref:hypothetical protein n=1 Tax=Streptomyces sp. IMTB 2501 TaxID=1776340 RepID=UPI00096C43BB|nr:hypothetical protein [Streptomyces sp. IMTB 2501]OLZ70932.1 hypothetical protein AV521_13100 [Streptomyces sp. IMTB 2501]